jgi:hypothetical protein
MLYPDPKTIFPFTISTFELGGIEIPLTSLKSFDPSLSVTSKVRLDDPVLQALNPTIICLLLVADTIVVSEALDNDTSVDKKLFAIYPPKAIANGIAFGSDSVTLTPPGNVIAFVDVLIENKVKLSDPSFNFIEIVPEEELSHQIVPATAEPGAELPMCDELIAPIILFNSVLKLANPWLSNVTSDTWLIFSYTLFC